MIAPTRRYKAVLLLLFLFVAAIAAMAPAAFAAENRIFTVAGTGAAGFSGDGGPATSAKLHGPRGFVATGDGGYLVADAEGNRVRRVLPNGTITTVAGTGFKGFSGDGGPATSAKLNFPHAVAMLPDGGFLIADTNNFRIRRVSPTGTISTVAGIGIRAFSGDGGAAVAARITAPRGLASLPDGSYLIPDTDNNRIRKVSTTGVSLPPASSPRSPARAPTASAGTAARQPAPR